MTGTTRIEVGGAAPYPVLVGRDLTEDLVGLVPGAAQAAVIFAPTVRPIADRVAAGLRSAGLAVLPIEVPDAEAAKDLSVAARCWDVLGRANATRTDVVIGVGGGALTDLAGFVAACWLRGVRWGPVATSVLGMVDAAIGGKTGLNTVAGKNLVGAFHPPVGVLCDLSTLDSLGPDELVTGLAEVVKAGFIADPEILSIVERDPAAATDPAGPALRELIERSVRVKARVVAQDLTESGPREILNYGHTLAHAIEKVEGYRWRHGHAVAIGMVYAAELARLAGRLHEGVVERHRSVLSAVGRPTSYGADGWPRLRAAMRLDKKARGALLRFVVLDGPGEPSRLEGPDEALLRRAYDAIAR